MAKKKKKKAVKKNEALTPLKIRILNFLHSNHIRAFRLCWRGAI